MDKTLKKTTSDVKEPVTVAGNPLDFSFLEIKDIVSLRKKDPRAGKRKPIEESVDEEEDKKNENLLNPLGGFEEGKGEEEKAPKEKKEEVIKAQHSAQIHALLPTSNVPLNAAKNILGGRKAEEAKVETTKKKKITIVCNSIFLNNNEIRSLTPLYPTLDAVMWNVDRLEWIDLSYNYLTKIDADLLEFVNLKTLYLHGNYVAKLTEADKLRALPLQSLTLHGNPIEQISGYRMYLLGMFIDSNSLFKKLDSVVVTRKERDNVRVYNERLHADKKRRLGKLKPENIKEPPPIQEEDTKQGKKTEDKKEAA